MLELLNGKFDTPILAFACNNSNNVDALLTLKTQ